MYLKLQRPLHLSLKSKIITKFYGIECLKIHIAYDLIHHLRSGCFISVMGEYPFYSANAKVNQKF